MNLNVTNYGQGKALVFFHGWGFDQQIWHPLLPDLIASYQIFLVDLPGFGLSSIMQWEAFKAQLIKLLPEQFALVGWSMGGLYATRFALEEPTKVSALLNISTSPRFIEDGQWPGVSQDVFKTFYKHLALNPEETVREFVALQNRGSYLPELLVNPASQAGLEQGLSILDTWDLRQDLHRLSLPTCYLFGRLDPITSAKTMKTMESTYPRFSYRLFPGAAHMPFLSHQTEFIKLLREVIQ